MDKENNNRSAAGLRRSAVVERIRLREEWSALKGTEASSARPQIGVLAKSHGNIAKNILKKKQSNFQSARNICDMRDKNKENTRGKHLACDTLRGVVALVDVGSETRALALRAALSALGASVVPVWSPLVTHLVWAQGGCRSTRAKARALACVVVSPLWVEACAGAARRLLEHAFPAAARPSDLPSPGTLTRMLKQAELDNISLTDLLDDSKEDKPLRLRISSETEHDTSAETADTSRDTSADKSRDTTADVESRVNTAPRRALPLSVSVSPVPRTGKSRRKLFTYKEGELAGRTSDESETEIRPKRTPSKLTQRERRDLARAERMAKKLVAACTHTNANTHHNMVQATLKPRIVLTGMCCSERRRITNAIQSLNGRIQSHVNKRTTHVLLGSCQEDTTTATGDKDVKNVCSNITGITNHSPDRVVHRSDIIKARTVNALAGAARGCRVLYAQWALHSVEMKKWLHHHGYEVQHLRKISQKARIERTALGRSRSEYAYDVFSGMKVQISPNAEQKDGATQLLTLCGAVVQNGGPTRNGGLTQNGGLTRNGGLTQNGGLNRNGGLTQNGGDQSADFDIRIGTGDGEISSKWVFDSVAAGRMRTTRRYKNTSIPDSGNLFTSLKTDK